MFLDQIDRPNALQVQEATEMVVNRACTQCRVEGASEKKQLAFHVFLDEFWVRQQMKRARA